MSELDIFDILGPIMIGPSSSHTAGAVRLGNMAALIYRRPIERINCLLHGSFAKTYRGHGTDLALVAGLLGMSPDDERLPEAFSLAEQAGLRVSFEEADLGYVHPNTVKFEIEGEAGAMMIVGSSLGGATIEVIQINQTAVSLRGDYPTLILDYTDKPGMISRISSSIASAGVNIAAMKVTRNRQIATMVLELDGQIPRATLVALEKDPSFLSISDIGAVEEQDAL
ncbi:MAG TPA: L-serine ammonia-lyase, iron-sulfur-dependent, subunit beta [Tissierellia bacterium]|nr:L-serine ammonia-lyase, iron-sulfur-dependent, subunit beta [Tissierellia bacterium]